MLYSSLTNEELLRQLGTTGHTGAVQEMICRFPALMRLETDRIKELESEVDTLDGQLAKMCRGGCTCEL